jgi:hypothetical protein
MIRRLLWKNYGKWQILGASFGALAGLLLLMAVIQFYFEMQNVLQTNKDLLDPEYIVINKRIGLLETLNFRDAVFDKEEIEEIRQQPFVEKVEGFISNDFALSAYTESDRFPDFFTDLFFEAIPDGYLDIKSDDWNWRRGQRTIPIILPQEYLNLYNFGFAPSQGLPQISPTTMGLVNFRISITGNGKTELFNGRISGFSNRINSILVPYSFLSWANKEFGNGNKSTVSRLVIETKDPTNPEIVNFLTSKGYETIREKLKSSRLNIILKFIISFLGSLGFVIILLAFMVFFLSFQLLISKSSEKIRRLKWLGYHYMEISKPYLINLALIMGIIAIVCFVLVFLLKQLLIRFTEEWAMEFTEGINPLVLLTGAGLIILIFVANSLSIINLTKKIY